jgi:hypothetical protein
MREPMLMRVTFACLSLCAAFAIGPVSAQDAGERLDTIVVTGSNISYRDLLDTPAVSITRPGDYLLLGFTLTNDTRSEKGREDEIYATIRKMLASAGSRFELVHGETYVSRIDGRNLRLPLEKDSKRPDVSQVSLFARTSIGDAPERAEEMTRTLREFVAKAEKVGRTEIDSAKETALSLSRPERFRLELIKAIADDTSNLRSTIGNNCEISIQGLSSRIEWQRVSAAELMLYIPYTLEIRGCGTASGQVPAPGH